MKVKCKSGSTGWRQRLQSVYADCADPFEAFKSYAEMYGLHTRLGYKTPAAAWKANPMVEGSTNPSDYRKVKK